MKKFEFIRGELFFNKCVFISNIDIVGRMSYESFCGVWILFKKLKLVKVVFGVIGLCFFFVFFVCIYILI